MPPDGYFEYAVPPWRNGLANMTGSARKHHEVYLGDPRCTAPERLKTVIRLPVDKA